MKFTFKKMPDLWGWDRHLIKFKRKEVGYIVDDNNVFPIRLMVIKDDINEDGNPNSDWKWIKLAKKSKSVDEVKAWLNDNIEAIFSKHNIRMIEE